MASHTFRGGNWSSLPTDSVRFSNWAGAGVSVVPWRSLSCCGSNKCWTRVAMPLSEKPNSALETTLGQMAPPKTGHRLSIKPDSGGILRGCPLLGGAICLNVVSRAEGVWRGRKTCRAPSMASGMCQTNYPAASTSGPADQAPLE